MLLSTVVHIMWGNKVTLNCSVASLDISEVQWTVNGAVVDSKLHSRLAQFDSRQLDVDGVLYSDSHLNIVCSVKVNDSAIAAERFWLNVSGRVVLVLFVKRMFGIFSVLYRGSGCSY